MPIQVNSDKNVDAREERVRQVEADVDAALSRFNDRLTRVEVYVGDESAGRSSGADMRSEIVRKTPKRRPAPPSICHGIQIVNDTPRSAPRSPLSIALHPQFHP